MPVFTPAYRYNDLNLVPPIPGAALIHDVGLVTSIPGAGPATGGDYIGVPIALGPMHTRLRRPHDNVEMTLPNDAVTLWNNPFHIAAHRARFFGQLSDLPGWDWLDWTVADHLAHDLQGARTRERTDPLVVVPCGAAKMTTPASADQLYIGGYHRLCLRAARALTAPRSTRILSARHGLLKLDEIVVPYDHRMGQPGSITPASLYAQAGHQGLLGHPQVIVLAGRAYSQLAKSVWPDADTPLAGTRGIGDQQHRLAEIAGRRA